MPDISIPDVDDQLLARLQERARQNGRTLPAEVKIILEGAIPPAEEIWARVDRLRNQLAASGRTFSDSTELVREDRDR
jgi:antitoxin FitA